MNRNIAFPTRHLSASPKPYRWMYKALVLLIILAVSVGLTNAQSQDRANPTRITSNEISGLIANDNRGDDYYYSLMAGPGPVTIILSVETDSVSGIYPKFSRVGVEVFDENGQQLTIKETSATSGSSNQKKVNLQLSRRHRLILRVYISDDALSDGTGRYHLRFSGAVNAGQDNPSSGSGSTRIRPEVNTNADSKRAWEFRQEAKRLLTLGRYIEAIENYTVAIYLDPSDPYSYSSRGDAKIGLRAYREAIADYDQVIRLYSAWEGEKEARRARGEKIGAFVIDVTFAEILSSVYYNRGFAKDRLGDKVGACEDFRRAGKVCN